MEFRISVPDALLSHPVTNQREVQSVLTRALIIELHQQGCMVRDTAAQAADMPADAFDAMLAAAKYPDAAYRMSGKEDFYPAEPGASPRRRSKSGPIFTAILIIACAAAGFFYRNRIASEYYVRQGLNYIVKEDPAEAAKMFGRALKYDPENPGANAQLGKYYINLADWSGEDGDMEKASENAKISLVYLLKAVQKSPGNPHILFYTGYASEILGKNEAAKDYYKRALDADPAYYAAKIRLDNLQNPPWIDGKAFDKIEKRPRLKQSGIDAE
jgi:tetratricopeptide (TPR) repeat protein